MPGRIDGRMRGENSIEFLKTMPATMWVLPNGEKTIDHGRAQKIHYRGIADGPNNFHGQWSVRGGFVLVNGTLVITRTSRGTWRMWRET
jgi:hypothetical protein